MPTVGGRRFPVSSPRFPCCRQASLGGASLLRRLRLGSKDCPFSVFAVEAFRSGHVGHAVTARFGRALGTPKNLPQVVPHLPGERKNGDDAVAPRCSTGCVIRSGSHSAEGRACFEVLVWRPSEKLGAARRASAILPLDESMNRGTSTKGLGLDDDTVRGRNQQFAAAGVAVLQVFGRNGGEARCRARRSGAGFALANCC